MRERTISEVSATQATPERIGVREFRANLTAILRRAKEGEAFVITSRDEVLAEIRPPAPPRRKRQPGALKGQIHLPPDFDETPEWLIDIMEGKGE
jgi:antitoxin (DNA-binding transcriptional repressor) of toxin-antitoxin stability system